jgi:DNA modification methylase/transposase-like protein
MAGVTTGDAPFQVMPPLTAEQYAALKADITTRGVIVPVEVDEAGNILDGHNRAQIATELGRVYPTVVRRGMTGAQKRQYARTLNLARRHLTPEQRRQVVLDLRREGWSYPRIAAALGVDPKTVRTDIEGWENSQPATVTGADGKVYPARKPAKSHAEAHRERLAAFEAEAIARGDLPFGRIVAADAEAFLEPLPDGSADLCVTSPPYWAKRTYSGDALELGQEAEPTAFVSRLCDIIDLIGRVLKPGGFLFLVLGDTYGSQPGQYRGDPDRQRGISPQAIAANGTAVDGRVLDVAPKSVVGIPWRVLVELTLRRGWRCANVIAWVKPNHQPENVHDRLTQAWEPILLVTRAEHGYLRRSELEDTGDVWEISAGRGGDAEGHLAPFPEALVERAIRAACPDAGVVLDPFAGSGTTLKVAHRLGRRFLGCDLSAAAVPA